MRINSLSEAAMFGADMNVITYSKIFDDLYRLSNIVVLVRLNGVLLTS